MEAVNYGGWSMDWIISDGGPLICMEAAHVPSWRGIDGLSVRIPSASNDYGRACEATAYTTSVPLTAGDGLVLTMGALETSIWTLPSGAICIVSVECAEPEVDEPEMLALMDESIFDHPLNKTEIAFATGHLMIFDSAASGNEIDEPSLKFDVAPGHYAVLTQTFDPDETASFIVYKFQQTADLDQASAD